MSALLLLAALAATPATSDVAVLLHPIARGEIVAREDVAAEPRAAAAVGLALSPKAVIGQEAVRDLPAGLVLGRSDVIAPRLVKRGTPVTLWVRQPGLVIATEGRALASGAQGDSVRVFSVATNRTLDGTVEGPAAVRIVAP